MRGGIDGVDRIVRSSEGPLRAFNGTEDAVSNKTVKHEVDLADLPPLSENQKTELSAMAGRLDSEIDYSDIPPLTEQFWEDAVRGLGRKLIRRPD